MAIKKKGLVMYASITGNTEKVAKAFGNAFEKSGWECTLLKIDGKTNLKKNPVYFDDYDIIALGSPIMAGLPSPEIARVLALTQAEPPRVWSGGGMGPQSRAMQDNVKAIVFATYAGGIREAYSTLAVEKQYLECLGVKIVGQFSCTGKEIHHMGVDKASEIMGIQVEKAADILQKYREDPNNILFSKLTDQQRKAMEDAISDKRDMPAYEGMQSFVPPKYDLENRPSERDLIKAEIFMQEIIEDFFFGREIPQETHGEYLCIG